MDVQLIHNSLRVRLSKARLFAPVSRGQLETLLQEQQLEQSGLADSETAAEVGRLVGAQYVLHGSIAAIRTRQESEVQIVYTLTLVLTEIETGLDAWVDEAEVRKTASLGGLLRQ